MLIWGKRNAKKLVLGIDSRNFLVYNEHEHLSDGMGLSFHCWKDAGQSRLEIGRKGV